MQTAFFLGEKGNEPMPQRGMGSERKNAYRIFPRRKSGDRGMFFSKNPIRIFLLQYANATKHLRKGSAIASPVMRLLERKNANRIFPYFFLIFLSKSVNKMVMPWVKAIINSTTRKMPSMP
jgi:hypothetical protein